MSRPGTGGRVLPNSNSTKEGVHFTGSPQGSEHHISITLLELQDQRNVQYNSPRCIKLAAMVSNIQLLP